MLIHFPAISFSRPKFLILGGGGGGASLIRRVWSFSFFVPDNKIPSAIASPTSSSGSLNKSTFSCCESGISMLWLSYLHYHIWIKPCSNHGNLRFPTSILLWKKTHCWPRLIRRRLVSQYNVHVYHLMLYKLRHLQLSKASACHFPTSWCDFSVDSDIPELMKFIVNSLSDYILIQNTFKDEKMVCKLNIFIGWLRTLYGGGSQTFFSATPIFVKSQTTDTCDPTTRKH